MKHLKLALLAVTAFGGFSMAGAASADTVVAWNVGVATDYYFRGIDQTSEDSMGEIFGGVDVTGGPNLYGGIWVSSTGPWDGDAAIEYDVYGGWRPSAGGINFDVGAIFYGYTDSDGGYVSSDFNTFELRAGASVPVGGATLGANVFWSPDFAGSDSDAVYAEATDSYTFSNHATVSGTVGRQFLDENTYGFDGYTTWNVGVTYPITEHISVDVRYIGTDDDAQFFAPIGHDDTVVGTLKATF
jgi:uncharacterized protein (TIGR02001 family)